MFVLYLCAERGISQLMQKQLHSKPFSTSSTNAREPFLSLANGINTSTVIPFHKQIAKLNMLYLVNSFVNILIDNFINRVS